MPLIQSMAACAGLGVDRRDLDRAVVLDVDLGAGGLGDLADHLAAGADHFADLVLGDGDTGDARRVLADRLARAAQPLAISPRMCMRPSFAWPSATFMISSVIEVILMSICSEVMPLLGAGHLEVHVAEMILVAQDVGEHGEALAFLDQAHGDARHRPLQRHAGVHQRQRAAAHRRHRRRAVALGDLRHDADRVGELLLAAAASGAARARRACRGRSRGGPASPCGRTSPTE